MWKTNVKTKVITTFIMLSIILMGFFIKSGLPINIGQGLVVISSFCWHINHFYFSVFFYHIHISSLSIRNSIVHKWWFPEIFEIVIRRNPHPLCTFFYGCNDSITALVWSLFYLVLSIHRHLFIDSRSSHWYGWYLRRLENNDHFFPIQQMRCPHNSFQIILILQ